MNRLFVASTIVIVLLTGCHFSTLTQESSILPPKPQPLQAGNSTATLSVQGQTRTYFIHVPKTFHKTQAIPLVLVFHGYGGQGKDLARSTGFNDLADHQGFLVAYPNGLERRWEIDSDNDVNFTAELIKQIQQQAKISPKRIYAVGISNGGFLIQRLACKLPRPIAAFASVVATLPTNLVDDCQSRFPVSMLMINGTNDLKVPWSGGVRPYGTILSVPDTVRFWQKHNQCSDKARSIALNPRVQIERYAACQQGAEVELVTLIGVGHLFPRGGDGSNSLIDGSLEVWRFFQKHRS